MVWDATFRYPAAGVVEGEVVRVPTVEGGIVAEVLVKEGHRVEPGAVLVRLANIELRHERLRLEDELAEAISGLAAMMMELKWRDATHLDRYQEMPADYLFLKFVDMMAFTEEALMRRSFKDHFCPEHVQAATWRW